MEKPNSKEVKRISVALDENTEKLLDELVSKKNMTVSDIVRMAILTYSELESNGGEINITKLKEYAALLYGGESVIVDIELWTCILDELNERASEKIWNCVESIGEMYGIQFKNMGFTSIKQTLKYLEATNWFRLKTNGEEGYTLILRARSEGKLFKLFLENMFRAQGIPVEIVDGMRKLIVMRKD